MVPPSEETSFNHLQWSVFQSSYYTIILSLPLTQLTLHSTNSPSFPPDQSRAKLKQTDPIYDMNVTSFSVFHTEATVSIGLKNVLRMVTSILQN